VGETCGTHGRGKKLVQAFGGEAHLDVPGVNGTTGSKWTLERLSGVGGAVDSPG
jgi:hypothetical protein